jgi:hypothetical protein
MKELNLVQREEKEENDFDITEAFELVIDTEIGAGIVAGIVKATPKKEIAVEIEAR